jgi:DNA-binding CsgD family transcriptional regulator
VDISEVRDAADRLGEVSEEMRALSDLPPLPESSSIEDAIDNALTTVKSAIAAVGSNHARRVAELVSISLALQMDLQRRLTARRSRVAATLMTSLRTVTNSTDARALPQLVCDELVIGAEFSTALYSVIEDGSLRTLAGSSVHCSKVELSRVPVEISMGTVEYDCLTDITAILTSGATTCCGWFGELLNSTAYAVFAIVVEGGPVAMVHVAHDPPLGLGTAEVEVAAMYQAAVAVAVSRNTIRARFDRQRTKIHRIAAAMVTEPDDDTSTGPNVTAFEIATDRENLGAGSQHHPSPPAHNAHLESELTEREAEIHRLIVAGASNADIADQLYIGAETVKTHVKRVLRKVGAINRSEAITLHWQPR